MAISLILNPIEPSSPVPTTPRRQKSFVDYISPPPSLRSCPKIGPCSPQSPWHKAQFGKKSPWGPMKYGVEDPHCYNVDPVLDHIRHLPASPSDFEYGGGASRRLRRAVLADDSAPSSRWTIPLAPFLDLGTVPIGSALMTKTQRQRLKKALKHEILKAVEPRRKRLEAIERFSKRFPPGAYQAKLEAMVEDERAIKNQKLREEKEELLVAKFKTSLKRHNCDENCHSVAVREETDSYLETPCCKGLLARA